MDCTTETNTAGAATDNKEEVVELPPITEEEYRRGQAVQERWQAGRAQDGGTASGLAREPESDQRYDGGGGGGGKGRHEYDIWGGHP